MLRDAVLLTVTFPKFTLEGFTDRLNPAAMPVPVSARADGELDALLASVRLPVETATVLGLNCTLKVVDCPAFNVSGRFNPEVLKPVPVMFALVMVTLMALGLTT